jgi:hypothetical protein
MPMVDKADDAIALWQQMVGEMQKGFRAFGDQLSRGSSEQVPAGPDSAQGRLADLMESYFAGMNLPSRAQLNGLSDRLQAIESELTDIKALLHKALTNSRPMQEDPPEQNAPKDNAPKDNAPKASQPRPKRPPLARSKPVPVGKNAPLVPDDGDKPK